MFIGVCSHHNLNPLRIQEVRESEAAREGGGVKRKRGCVTKAELSSC